MPPEGSGGAGGAPPHYTADAPQSPLSRASAVLGALAALGGEAVDAVVRQTAPGAAVYAAGGWARSRGWMKAKETVTGTAADVIVQPEVTAVGAALLAATAIGRTVDPAVALGATARR